MPRTEDEEENIELLKLNDSDSGEDSDTETTSSSSSSRPQSSRPPKEYLVDGVTYTHEELYPTVWGEVKEVAKRYKQILLASVVLASAMCKLNSARGMEHFTAHKSPPSFANTPEPPFFLSNRRGCHTNDSQDPQLWCPTYISKIHPGDRGSA